MLHPLLAPLLALVSIAGDEPQVVEPARETRVEVHQGRAVGVRKGEPERTLRRGEPWVTEGEVHLEVGAGAEVRILWPGRGSLQVWGPASLQWGPMDPDVATGPDDLAIRFFEVAWVDVETRRGEHELRLPGGWRARLGDVAIHLRGLPSGPVELRHHAGRPVRLDWLGEERDARPAITVYPGSNVRLDRPAEPPGRDRRDVKAWGEFEWPWRRGAGAPAGLDERGLPIRGVSPQGGAVATVPVRPSMPLHITLTPDTPAATGTSTGEAPEPDAGSSRGVAREELARVGSIQVQRAPGVKVRSLANGRWLVTLDPLAPTPIWVFGAHEDYRLRPGAFAVFEADGSLTVQYGTVRGAAPAPGRPASDAPRR